MWKVQNSLTTVKKEATFLSYMIGLQNAIIMIKVVESVLQQVMVLECSYFHFLLQPLS